jgi:hypothetical protein
MILGEPQDGPARAAMPVSSHTFIPAMVCS